MLYSGFNTLHRSVFWSADFNGRSDNTDVVSLMNMTTFFANSEDFDLMVLRPLSHIDLCWELIWDDDANAYVEDREFGMLVNQLMAELGETDPPAKYHDNEDALAEYVKQNFNWGIKKVNGRWAGDYASVLEQGGFSDINQSELVHAAAGRIASARTFGQNHFDEMEPGHQKMLASVISIIVYHRSTLGNA